MRETRGYFNKISNDLDSALTKNAAVSKSRPGELEDASNLLTATRCRVPLQTSLCCTVKCVTARRSCFRYTGLDYVYQISMLQQKKKRVVLDSLTNFVSAYNTFFHQVDSSHCSMS